MRRDGPVPHERDVFMRIQLADLEPVQTLRTMERKRSKYVGCSIDAQPMPLHPGSRSQQVCPQPHLVILPGTGLAGRVRSCSRAEVDTRNSESNAGLGEVNLNDRLGPFMTRPIAVPPPIRQTNVTRAISSIPTCCLYCHHYRHLPASHNACRMRHASV